MSDAKVVSTGGRSCEGGQSLRKKMSLPRFVGLVCVFGLFGLPFVFGPQATASAAGFRVVDDDEERLHVYEGEKPVLTYNYGMQMKQGVPKDRQRSSYVHPVYGLDGEVLTADFPQDHYHHRGVSWMWPRMKVGEREVDLWHIQGIRQHFNRWIRREVSANGAVLKVLNDWKLDGQKTVAKETVTIDVHPAQEKGRAIDFRLRFRALEEPIMLWGQVRKGYGGFCFRFGPRESTVITTEEGRQEDSNLKPFRWADLSGQFRDRNEVSGAAVFVHPDNPDSPNGWTLRHYGFLGPCWPALEKYWLRPGQPVTLNYRVWIHQGGAKEGNVAQAYASYLDEVERTE